MINVGDKVKIISKTRAKSSYDFAIGMRQYCGMAATIIKPYVLSDNRVTYKLNIDNEYWNWYPDMFALSH